MTGPQNRAALDNIAQIRAAVEKARCQKTFKAFVLKAYPIVENDPFIDGRHIDLICAHLEAVAHFDLKKLIINIPPRCMKSLLASVLWPAWIWTWNPNARFIFGSYAQNLSTRDSGKCRKLVISDWYQAHWGDQVQISKNREMRIELASGGYRIATSVGGGATGEGGDYIGVDDPLNAEDGNSAIEREKSFRWLSETMASRFNNPKKTAYLLVMQRLHQADPTGRQLAVGGYEHLCLPMRYEKDRHCTTPFGADWRKKEGELLWPERMGEAEVRDLEMQLREYGTAGQLQQRPAPRGGGMFKRAWFAVQRNCPTGPKTSLVRYWDFAGTAENATAADPCYTVGVLGAMHAGKFYLVDIVRGRWSALEKEQIVRSTAERDGRNVAIWIEQEPGSSGKDLIDHYRREVLSGYAVRGDLPGASKEVRWDPLAAAAEGGNVIMLAGEWNEAFLAEAEVAPLGTFKDQLDAAAGSYNKLTGRKLRGVM